MTQIRRMHREGKTQREVMGYFEERYGTWVRLEPTAKGLSWWLWGAPIGVLCAGLLLGLWYVRAHRGAQKGGDVDDGTR